MKTNPTQHCASCGKEREKLYQHNICRICLDESFANLRPMIDSFRAMGEQGPANRDVAVSCGAT